MRSCVPGEVLRQCSAVNPVDISCRLYVVYGGRLRTHSVMTVMGLRKRSFYISGQYHAEVADTAVCTPNFTVLPTPH